MAIKTDLKRLVRDKRFYIGLFVLAFGGVLTAITSNYVVNNFSPPVLQDLILANIYFLKVAWVYDILATLSIFALLLYLLNGKLKQMPYFLVLIGILYTLRALFIVFTPLGNPGIDNNALFIGPINLAGLYFSGHTAFAFLSFLLVKTKAFKITFLTILFGIIFFLLLARGHYTIDILSGLIFAYAIYAFGQNNLRDLLVSR